MGFWSSLLNDKKDDDLFLEDCRNLGLTDDEIEDCKKSGIAPEEWLRENEPENYEDQELDE